jgi:hypothetical protein
MNDNIGIWISLILFLSNTMIDAVLIGVCFWLYHKIFRAKAVIIENNQELLEHDKIIAKLEERLKILKSEQK